MRRRLIVLRHAKSEWSGGVDDHDRPLAGRGRREAGLAGEWLREQVADVGLVVCSSATRARRTWKRVAKQLDTTPELRVDDRMYGASDRQLGGVVRELPDTARVVLFIGHNPGLEDVVAQLSGVWCPLKTSSIAVLSSRSAGPTPGSAGRGWRPRSPPGRSADRGSTPISSNTRIQPGWVAAQVSGRPAATRRSTSSTTQSGSVNTTRHRDGPVGVAEGARRACTPNASVCALAWCWAACTTGG